MKESTSGSTHINIFDTVFTEVDYEVGDILLALKDIIYESESRNRFSISWGTKRRRSAIDSSPSPPRLRSSPCLRRTSQEERETDRRPKVKPEATSPSTPLCFSPSESDEKSKHSLKRNSKKRTNKEWLEIIDGLTQRKELLTREVDVVKGYYNKQMAFNLALKAKKDELNCWLNKQKPQLEINQALHLGIKVDQKYHVSVFPHQQPSFINQAAYQSQTSGKFHYPNGQSVQFLSSNTGLGMVNQAGIPNLNVCAEVTSGMVDSSQAFDLNRIRADTTKIMAAEARKRRMIKVNQKKNSLATVKVQRCR